MISIVIPLYIEEYSPQIDFTLNYYNNLGAIHEVILVDDCSKCEIKRFENIKYFRIENDIVWNQPAARNLGASKATGDYLVFVDIDHLLPVDLEIFEKGSTLFPRLYNGKQIPPNQGVIGIRKEEFKGFDEEFCGNYGKDDKFFLYEHPPIRTSNSRVVVLNSNTHSLHRDSTINEELFKKKVWQKRKNKSKKLPSYLGTNLKIP